jgi:hypothetical protein
LKLANYFLAASVGIKHLTEEGPEGVLLRKKPSATHGPIPLRFQKRVGNKFLKDLADLLERFLLQQSHFFGKFLLRRSGLSTKREHMESWKNRR